jgi:putative endonuclease
MSYWVYIIQSQSSGRYYCGHSDNVQRRVNQHNDPEYRSTRTTKIFPGPWKVVWTQKLERKIKKRGIGRYLTDVQLAESPAKAGRD